MFLPEDFQENDYYVSDAINTYLDKGKHAFLIANAD